MEIDNSLVEYYPFEGCEKRLRITFKPIQDLTTFIEKAQWIEILKHAQCSILNTIENSECIVHLLSESSLFVFKHKLMIKTCGTTTLLNIIPILIQKYDLQIDTVFYSRSHFMFPQDQAPTYRSFKNEIQYLNTIFNDKGNAITLGSMHEKWHCYEYDGVSKCDETKEKTLEIVLFDLNPESMVYFFDKNEAKYNKLYVDEYILKNCFIPKEARIDSYLFKPCGYSLNALLNDKYWSLHITPQNESSFVSFETNYNYNHNTYENVIQNILKTFKPKRFGFAVNGYMVKGSEKDVVHIEFDGFHLTDNATHRFSKYHDVKWLNYKHKELSKQPTFPYSYVRIVLLLAFCFGYFLR